MKTLAERLLAHPNFQITGGLCFADAATHAKEWVRGASDGRVYLFDEVLVEDALREGRVEVHEPEVDRDYDELPDECVLVIEDPATLGILAAQTRERYRDPKMRARYSQSRQRWEVYTSFDDPRGTGATEADAWATAWLAKSSSNTTTKQETPA